MAKSGGRPKAKKGAGKAKRAQGAPSDKPYKEDDLIRAVNHPLRRQILRLLHSSRDPLSPMQIEKTLELGDEPKENLSTISYHVRVLADYKISPKVGQRQVRGAMQRFYVSEVSDSACVRGLLKRTLESDEAQLWPKGREQSGKKAPKKKRR
jgi:DNA-binding transcriptional ArsR family regulator